MLTQHFGQCSFTGTNVASYCNMLRFWFCFCHAPYPPGGGEFLISDKIE
jgi:hypothetical protein